MIMVASYTANLAAFLTVEAKFCPIKSVSDLANNPYGINYGAKKGGATFSFFKVIYIRKIGLIAWILLILTYFIYLGIGQLTLSKNVPIYGGSSRISNCD